VHKDQIGLFKSLIELMLQVLPYHQLMLETFLEGVMRRVEVACLQEFFNLVIKQVK